MKKAFVFSAFILLCKTALGDQAPIEDPGNILKQANLLSPQYVMVLSILATVGLVAMWVAFWWAVVRSKESIHEVLLSAAFFRTVVVMGVIAAAVVLGLSGRLEGNVTGSILSGIVGYVLGQISNRSQSNAELRTKSFRK